MMKKIILFVTFLFLFTFSSFAFEIKGFKGGMTLEEVTIEAHSRNWQISEYTENNWELKNLKNERELHLTFCKTNKKLNGAGFNYKTESSHSFSELIIDYQNSGLKIIDTKIYNVRKDNPNWNVIQITLKSDSSEDNVDVMFLTSAENDLQYEIRYSNSKYCETND